MSFSLNPAMKGSRHYAFHEEKQKQTIKKVKNKQ